MCDVNKSSWTVGRKLTIQHDDLILKNVKIWFSKGCSGKVYIVVKINGTDFLPGLGGLGLVEPANPNGYGNAYFGDDMTWPLHNPRELRRNDVIEVYYVNTDNSNQHQVGVNIEFVMKPPNYNVDTEGTGTGRRKTYDSYPAQEITSTSRAQRVSYGSRSVSQFPRAMSESEQNRERTEGPRRQYARRDLR